MIYKPLVVSFLGSILLPAALAASLSAASITFNDGQAHTIPGDPAFTNGDSVQVSGTGTALNVLNGAAMSSPPANVLGSVLGGDSLVVGGNASVFFAGGSTTGGAATVGTHVSGSEISAGGGSGLLAGLNYQLSATGGTIVGGMATANGTFSGGFADSAEAGGGAGLYSNNATGSVDGATIIGGDAIASNSGTKFGSPGFPICCDAIASGGSGLDLFQGSFVVSSGTMVGGMAKSTTLGQGTSSASGGAGAAFIYSGSVTISGGSFTGGVATADSPGGGFAVATGGPGLVMSQQNNVTITGGQFLGGDASGAFATGGDGINVFRESKVKILGGTFSAGIGTSTTAPVVTKRGYGIEIGSQINGLTVVEIDGGTFTGAAGLFNNNPGLNVSQAQILIHGGDFIGLDGPDLVLKGPLPTYIFGNNFRLNGIPASAGSVVATSGTLTGILDSGAAFEWTFSRQSATPLFLVTPEPAGLIMFAVVLFPLLFIRVRS